jgi:hypothetical protein
MAYLDVSPMVAALRERPEDFEMKGKWLLHKASHHRFKLGCEGNVRLEAPCDCSFLTVSRGQGQELWQAYQIWHQAYWRPTVINRQFASHFRQPSWWWRLLRHVVGHIENLRPGRAGSAGGRGLSPRRKNNEPKRETEGPRPAPLAKLSAPSGADGPCQTLGHAGKL